MNKLQCFRHLLHGIYLVGFLVIHLPHLAKSAYTDNEFEVEHCLLDRFLSLILWIWVIKNLWYSKSSTCFHQLYFTLSEMMCHSNSAPPSRSSNWENSSRIIPWCFASMDVPIVGIHSSYFPLSDYWSGARILHWACCNNSINALNVLSSVRHLWASNSW